VNKWPDAQFFILTIKPGVVDGQKESHQCYMATDATEMKSEPCLKKSSFQAETLGTSSPPAYQFLNDYGL
jgi:hypothetical protein